MEGHLPPGQAWLGRRQRTIDCISLQHDGVVLALRAGIGPAYVCGLPERRRPYRGNTFSLFTRIQIQSALKYMYDT